MYSDLLPTTYYPQGYAFKMGPNGLGYYSEGRASGTGTQGEGGGEEKEGVGEEKGTGVMDEDEIEI